MVLFPIFLSLFLDTSSLTNILKNYSNLLASASADKRVKIWDVVAGKCTLTMEHHTDKVRINLQCISLIRKKMGHIF